MVDRLIDDVTFSFCYFFLLLISVYLFITFKSARRQASACSGRSDIGIHCTISQPVLQLLLPLILI